MTMSLLSRLSRINKPLMQFHFHSHPQLQQRIASFGSLPRLDRGRDALLRKVYAPFAGLVKGSPEYVALAQSGRVWEDHFRPGDSDRYGYTKLQQRYAGLLDSIDDWRGSIKMPSSAISSLVPAYAHQSVAIEDNRLELEDSITLNDHLESSLPELTSLTAFELAQRALPDVRPLLPHADASQLAELRNHIIASHWVTEGALHNPGTAGISEHEIRCLSAVLLKDTPSEEAHRHAWGKRISPGDYRSAPIGVKSNPLRIFPYHDEVPACMRRFIQWRDEAAREKRLHPLIAACQMTAYFLHIHPFLDGNGRVSRLLMQDYMIRHGYAPVVIPNLERRHYVDMISRAQDGEPDEFARTILTTVLEELQTLGLRQTTTR